MHDYSEFVSWVELLTGLSLKHQACIRLASVDFEHARAILLSGVNDRLWC